MASTFRHKGGRKNSSKGPSILRGTKPWTGGIQLTSTGLRELDKLLGGGQPLGSCILVEEDRWTRSLTDSFVRYWLAEGAAHGHRFLVPLAVAASTRDVGIARRDVQRLFSSLPRNLTLRREKVGEQTDERETRLDILEERDEDQDAQAENLEIAWQYKSDVQRERLGHSGINMGERSSHFGDFCYSYDLNGIDEFDTDTLNIMDCCAKSVLVQSVINQITGLLEKGHGVIRILLRHSDADTLCFAVPQLLAYFRERKLPVVVLISVKPWEQVARAQLECLKRSCDVVLSTEGFASRRSFPQPPEFRHLHGLLHVQRVSTVTAAMVNGGGHFADLTTGKRVDPMCMYGLKRDRRKLNIVMLHIPPEDQAISGGHGSGGVRSGSGRPPKKDHSSLEF